VRLALVLLVAPAMVGAQRDSTRTTALDAVVVTAERARSTLGSSTAAVTRIEGTELMRLPHATVADVLRIVPGFAVVSFDGMGQDPQIMARGFYGGGEAEYVVVMVDGIPVDQLHTGLVPWDALPPLTAIEAVEVVRGGSSALYGSAAIGAVINVITRRDAPKSLLTDVSAGKFATVRVAAAYGSLLSAGLDRTDGFREHGQRATGRVRAGVELAPGIRLTAASHWRAFDDPGALLESVVQRNPRASDSLFRFDHTRDRAHSLMLGLTRGMLTGSLAGELRHTNAVRTIPLAPGFGDTKERDVANGRLAATGQLALANLTLGADVSHGTIDSKYYQVDAGQQGALDAEGDGRRTAAALFVQYTLQPAEPVRIALGGRWDWLGDTFAAGDASHSAFSPKLGVNLRVAQATHAYVTAGRSFKAPTLDQLFDQRSIPFPFPPFSLTTSNRALVPQHGTNVEGGLYHASGSLTSSLSVYHMDMQDELDFDVQTLKYVNIGRSRHRGLEVAARYEPRPAHAIFATYTLQAAKARSGEHTGKQLKAIPRRVWSAGFTIAPIAPVSVSLMFTQTEKMFLDDANAREIDDYTRFDAQLSYAVTRRVRLTLEAINLADAAYSTTGFPDPAGGAEAYFYPATRRVLSLGVRHGW
jgi:outer membrane cobalamin receptor